MAIKIRNVFYVEGNPTYKALPRTEFDSVEAAKVVIPNSKKEVDGIVFRKGTHVVGHLTISNLPYCHLVDENNIQVMKGCAGRSVKMLRNHSGQIESRERLGYDSSDERRMRDVFLHGTRLSDFDLD